MSADKPGEIDSGRFHQSLLNASYTNNSDQVTRASNTHKGSSHEIMLATVWSSVFDLDLPRDKSALT